MLQELQPEPISIVTDFDRTPLSENSLAHHLIQAGLKSMLKEDTKRWLPKSFFDLEAEWKVYRESQIRRPL